MVLCRALGWVSLVFAVGTAVFDGLNWWADGVFHVAAIGDLWSRFDLASLIAVQRGLGARAWGSLLLPIFKAPALPAFAITGALFLWLSSRSGNRPSPAFLGGTRPPRRRRGRF